MANVRGPLYSIGATGTIADQLTFQVLRGTKYCKNRPVPKKPKTAKQDNIRLYNALAVRLWHVLPTTIIDLWNEYTDKNNNTGYHAFMSLFMIMSLHGENQFRTPQGGLFGLVEEHLVSEIIVEGPAVH